MKQLLVVLAVLALASIAFAESSGSFSAKILTTQCLINNNTGVLEGGLPVPSTANLLSTTIQTPNSGGTALLIRPSLGVGLYTKNRLESTAIADYQTQTSTAIAGLQVRVLFDGKAVAPGTPIGGTGANEGWIYFDKRFVQMKSNIFNSALSGSACDDPATLDVIEPCFLELIQSTLSYHSGDFVVGGEAGAVGGGNHTLEVQWRLDPASTNFDGSEAACVGPGVITVEQVKVFNTSGGIVVGP